MTDDEILAALEADTRRPTFAEMLSDEQRDAIAKFMGIWDE